MDKPNADKQPKPVQTPVERQTAGSPQSGEPEFLVAGKLRAPHGVRGEMLMDVITDFPERLKPGVRVYVGEEHRPQHIRSLRGHNKGALIAFDGYNSPEAVGVLRNQLLYVATAELPPLPEGEYYHHQLIGLHVLGDDGQDLGRLDEILVTSANDIYVVRKPGAPDLLLPAIEAVVLNIDLERKEMTVHVLEGL